MALCTGYDLTGVMAQVSVPWVSIFIVKTYSLTLKRPASKKEVKIGMKSAIFSGKCHRSRLEGKPIKYVMPYLHKECHAPIKRII